ncbi:MAG TPA: hypothetical protein VF599_00250 [Pyrinomonadaceae bacterium]
MKKFESKLFSIIAIFLSTTAAAFGANRFEGYALKAAADDSGAFPAASAVQYRSGGNCDIDVFIAGTRSAAAAAHLAS